jgi:hypothetical protein
LCIVIIYIAGDSVTFECELDDATAAQIQWLRNNVPFNDRLADRVQIISEDKVNKLVLKHCRYSDAGLITAQATNPYGSSTSSAQFVVADSEFIHEIRLLSICTYIPELSVHCTHLPSGKFKKEQKVDMHVS